MTSQWNLRLDRAKRDRSRYRVENEHADEEICHRLKNPQSRRRRQRLQKPELQDLQLGAVM